MSSIVIVVIRKDQIVFLSKNNKISSLAIIFSIQNGQAIFSILIQLKGTNKMFKINEKNITLKQTDHKAGGLELLKALWRRLLELVK